MSEELSRPLLDAYDRGRIGSSVRSLALRGLPPRQAHEKLTGAGFWPQRLPVAAHTRRTGDPQWRLEPSGTCPAEKDVPTLASEYAYVHADGGVVRLFPQSSPLAALDVVPGPWARKSVLVVPPSSLAPIDLTLEREAFVVTEEGNPIPKSPRALHGLKYDPTQCRASHALARAIVVAARLPLGQGDFPTVPLAPAGVGLSRGFTIAPEGDFWALAEELCSTATREPVLLRMEQGDVRMFFAGDVPLAGALVAEKPRTALASMVIHHGECVISVEPIGYEASVEHLARFVGERLSRPEWKCFDNATGRDISLIAERLPSRLFTADPPGEIPIYV